MIDFSTVKEWTIPVNGIQTDVLRVTCNNIVLWEKQTGPIYNEPFYVENTGNSTKQVTIGAISTNMTIYTSTNKTDWTSRTISQYYDISINVPANSKLYIEYDSTSFPRWPGEIEFSDKIGGNFMSLIYGRSFNGTERAFPTNNTRLASVFQSSGITDASELILPVTTLSEYCYANMFAYCASLASAPVLPATTLANFCYNSMFKQCTSLTTAPDLLATTLVNDCYNSMFDGCTSLNYVKCLATSGFDTNYPTGYWLRNVSSTGTFVKDANTSWSSGQDGIPSGWTIINQ